MEKTLISIIIPAYNLEKYIAKTLDTVFAQTYSEIEVIVVNDGSKDGTWKILEKYAEKENRLRIFNKENGGVTSARLFGIEKSTGDYIGFVDGDDLIDSDMYERLLFNAVENDADVSHCGYRVQKDKSIRYLYNTGKKIIQDNHQGIVDLLEGKFIEPGLCNKLYKKNIIEQMIADGHPDPELVINEDLLMNYYLFRLAKKSIYEDFCPYCYVKRDGSASQRDDRLIDYKYPILVRQLILDDSQNTDEQNLAGKIFISKALHYLSEFSVYDCKFPDIVLEWITIVKENKQYVKFLSLKQKINTYLLLCNYKLFLFVNKLIKKR